MKKFQANVIFTVGEENDNDGFFYNKAYVEETIDEMARAIENAPFPIKLNWGEIIEIK
jgi:hypothetical protein